MRNVCSHLRFWNHSLYRERPKPSNLHFNQVSIYVNLTNQGTFWLSQEVLELVENVGQACL